MSDDMSIPNSGYRANRPGRYGRLRGGMDPATRRLIMFAGGLAGVLVCLIGASTLSGHRSSAVPVVTADSRPIRVKPDKPGGMQIDGAENEVFSGGVDDRNAKLAPAAETPDPNGMRAAAMAPPATSPIAAEQAPPIAAKPPDETAPSPAQPAAVTTAAPPRAVSVAPAKPPVTAMAAPPPASASPALAPKPAAGPIATSGRPAMVQLAALTTEQAAREAWQQLSKRMPDLLSGRQPSFSRIERDGHTFWRLRMSGFPDVDQAKAFCDHVRAKGGGCSVADY